MEPEQQLTAKHSVLLARTLVQGNGRKVPIELMNPTGESCYLYKGTHVGLASKIQRINEEKAESMKQEGMMSLRPELEKLAQDIDTPLTREQKTAVRSLLQQNRDVFALPGDLPGRTGLVQHEIKVDTNAPIKQMVRRPPIHWKEAASQEVEKMLRDEVIEPSNSPWASPVVLVKKKDGTL